jgi:hypothetical protein
MSWEHKTVKFMASGVLGGIVDPEELDAKRNELGRDGWELATPFDTNLEYGRTRELVAVLRKPRGAHK